MEINKEKFPHNKLYNNSLFLGFGEEINEKMKFFNLETKVQTL